MILHDMGKTAEGRTQWMAIVTSPANHRNLARYQRHLAAARARRRADRRPGARAGEGRQGGRLDRRRPARHRDARRAAARRRWSTRWSAATTRRRGGSSTTASSCSSTPIRTATTWSPTGTCATQVPEQRSLGEPAAALPEVHRPRQQPRLLRLDAARDREHQPRALPRVAPADSLQPPPERPGRHGRVVVAAARSLQLQPRSAADPRPAGARHAHAPAAGHRRQAGRDDGVGRRRTTAGGTAASGTPATSTTSSRS